MELLYNEHEGGSAYVESYAKAKPSDFAKRIVSLREAGYSAVEEYQLGDNDFAVLRKERDIALVSYYPTVQEMRVVLESELSYPDFKDEPCCARCECLITQIDLEDYGMSYTVRLPDGRFIILDGGFEFEPDADKLMKCLKEQSPFDVPVIAAWIMTHPHIDHYRCYLVFEQKYSDSVKIQSFIYNFPDAVPDVERFRFILHNDEYKHIARLNDAVSRSGAVHYRAHTGEVFTFSGVRLEILSSPDDTFFIPIGDFNNQSLVIKMIAEGQTILWTTDAQLASCALAARFGSYLKSDILQVPHHFFVGGDKRAYDFINPETCLIASTAELSFALVSLYCTRYNEVNKHLLYDLDVKECFTGGDGNVVITVPYSPRPNARELLWGKIDKARKSVGAESWYFDELSADNCDFTVINTVWEKSDIFVDLIFEDSACNVTNIKITVEKKSFKRVNLLSADDADPDALYKNKTSLKNMGIPEGARFVAHFKSTNPVIISGKKPAVYYG